MLSVMGHLVEAVTGQKGGSGPDERKDESGGRSGRPGLKVQYVMV